MSTLRDLIRRVERLTPKDILRSRDPQAVEALIQALTRPADGAAK